MSIQPPVYIENVYSKIELAVINIFRSVAKITNIELRNELGEVELSAFDVTLERLRKELEGKVEKNVDADAVKAFTACSQWLEELDIIVKNRNLHLKPHHKYAKQLELDKLKVHKDPKTNVYEFLLLY